MPKLHRRLVAWAPTTKTNFVGLMIAVKWFAMWWLMHAQLIKHPNGTQRHSNLIVSISSQRIVRVVVRIPKLGRLAVHRVKQEQ